MCVYIFFFHLFFPCFLSISFSSPLQITHSHYSLSFQSVWFMHIMAFGFSYTLFDIYFMLPSNRSVLLLKHCHCRRYCWLLINEQYCTLLRIFCLIRLFRVHTLNIMLSHFTSLLCVCVSCCRYFPVPFLSIFIETFVVVFIFNCFISTLSLLSNYKLSVMKQIESHIPLHWKNKWRKMMMRAIEYQLESWVYGCHCYTSI